MGATTLTTSLKDTFDDVRALIAYLEQELPPGLRGQITTARELLDDAENKLADQGHDL
jgi:hypothetical protein